MMGLPSTPAAPPGGRPASRAEQAAALGVSVRHLYRLLAKERDGQAAWCPEDLPHVPIGDGPGRSRYWYRLDDDEASELPLGLMRIGEDGLLDPGTGPSGRAARPGRLEGRLGIRHYNERFGERPAEAKKCPHKFKPKRPKKGVA